MSRKRPDNHKRAASLSRALAVLCLFLALLSAGCAARDAGDDRDRQGGFYGGISGGVTR